MEPVIITPERFAEALKWINGDQTEIAEREVKQMIDSMAVGYRRRYRELYPFGSRPQLQSTMTNLPTIENICGPEAADLFRQCMKEQQERMASQRAQMVLSEQKPEREVGDRLDSVSLINSISHVASDAGEKITSSRAQIILYCIYGSHLAHTGSRLEIEHPQAWKYGPVFPRAYKKGSLSDTGICAESYEELMAKDPEIAGLLERKTTSMLFTPMVDLNACHKCKGSPYGKTVSRNPDKWGVQIDDGLIRDFFAKSI